MKRRTAMLALALVAIVGAAFANDGDRGGRHLSARLSGYNEVPTLSSSASATLVARINQDETEIEWELSYQDMESAVQQAHIHFGARAINGPIVLWFCTNLGNAPAGITVQACPAHDQRHVHGG